MVRPTETLMTGIRVGEVQSTYVGGAGHLIGWGISVYDEHGALAFNVAFGDKSEAEEARSSMNAIMAKALALKGSGS